MKGSEFAQSILNLTGAARDEKSRLAGLSKLVPSWILTKSWFPVTATAGGHTLTYYVTPDYFSVGDDQDSFYDPETPATFQAIADAFNSILPTRRMVRAIWGAATVKIPLVTPGKPFVIPGADMEKTASWIEKNRLVKAILDARGISPFTDLIAGHSKDIVIGPNLDGSHVAIYGAEAPPGWAKPVDVSFIQPYSTIHASNYADYSHGARLVFRTAILDGDPVDLVDVFTDPKLSELVSDQGPFYPRFPNTGPNFQKALNLETSPIPPSSIPPPIAPTIAKSSDNSALAVTMVVGAAGLIGVVSQIRGLGRR